MKNIILYLPVLIGLMLMVAGCQKEVMQPHGEPAGTRPCQYWI